jgi:multiple antibiotic resistance protein
MVNSTIFQSIGKSHSETQPYHLAKERFREIIVPPGIPVLSGPGSMTTVVLYGNKMDNPVDFIILSLILLAVLSVLLAIFIFSEKIERRVDQIVFNILTRLLGILVVAISVQFMVEGLNDIVSKWLNGM